MAEQVDDIGKVIEVVVDISLAVRPPEVLWQCRAIGQKDTMADDRVAALEANPGPERMAA